MSVDAPNRKHLLCLLQERAFKTKLDYEIVKYFNNLVSAYHDGVTALKTGARN